MIGNNSHIQQNKVLSRLSMRDCLEIYNMVIHPHKFTNEGSLNINLKGNKLEIKPKVPGQTNSMYYVLHITEDFDLILTRNSFNEKETIVPLKGTVNIMRYLKRRGLIYI